MTAENSTAARPGTFSPEALFVVGGIARALAITLATSLLDDVRPATLAWIAVTFAALALLAQSQRQWAGPARAPWVRADVLSCVVLGIVSGALTLAVFVAIDRLDITTGTAIELAGPLALAAALTRTRTNALAVAAAIAGTAMLTVIDIGDDRTALAMLAIAALAWAAYVLVGARVAAQQRGLAGLALAFAVASVAVAPLGIIHGADTFSSPRLWLLCCLVGALALAVGGGLDQIVLRRVAAARFALLLCLLPVITAFLEFLALDEQPSLRRVAGAALVVAGVSIQRVRPPTMTAPG